MRPDYWKLQATKNKNIFGAYPKKGRKRRSREKMTADGFSWTPPPASRVRWDVYLSFRGQDTRHGFTDRLYNALKKKCLRVFCDEDGLVRGDDIAPSLFEAIRDSAASIVIISPNYASSGFCLEALAKIVEGRRLIMPVFYRVDPSDVRRQKGPFEDLFRSLEQRFGEDKVVR